MTYSMRTFCFDATGTMYSVPEKAGMRLFSTSKPLMVRAFAGQAVRFSSWVIELRERKPMFAVRPYFYIIRFGADGLVDAERASKQQVARFDAFMEDGAERGQVVVDLRARFAVRGGEWTPDYEGRRMLENAALGRIRGIKRLSAIADGWGDSGL